ncbi:MAG: HEPN domain-containing protein [bacterium]|nr:HEPN domain-containing protein [bacterium]
MQNTAREFIDEAYSELKGTHVLPVPWFAPHIRVGRDYYAENLAGVDSLRRFEESMIAAFPAHFAKPPPPEYQHLPHFYTYSLLEEVVRRNAALYQYGTSPNGVDEGVVSECVEELLAALSSPEFEWAACRVVSHLTTTTGGPVKIGDILVQPAPRQWEVLRIIADVIPGSGGAASSDDLHYQEPGSVVQVCTKVKTWSDTSSTTDKLTGRIREFLNGVRLLTGATLASEIQVQGSTSRIGRIPPYMFDLRSPGLMNTLTHRVARLDQCDAEPFSRFFDLMHKATASQQNKLISSLSMALAMFDRSHQLVPWFDRLVDLSTALEAALIGDGDDNAGLRLRLRHRAATLLACETDSPTDLFKDVGELYDLRSTLVHGGDITTKALSKKIKRISVISAGPLLGRATEQALDRLRDIVRAILARICLSQGPDPLWTSDRSVDAVFADDRGRAEWRSAWQEHMAEIGVPGAVQRALPEARFGKQTED